MKGNSGIISCLLLIPTLCGAAYQWTDMKRPIGLYIWKDGDPRLRGVARANQPVLLPEVTKDKGDRAQRIKWFLRWP